MWCCKQNVILQQSAKRSLIHKRNDQSDRRIFDQLREISWKLPLAAMKTIIILRPSTCSRNEFQLKNGITAECDAGFYVIYLRWWFEWVTVDRMRRWIVVTQMNLASFRSVSAFQPLPLHSCIWPNETNSQRQSFNHLAFYEPFGAIRSVSRINETMPLCWRGLWMMRFGSLLVDRPGPLHVTLMILADYSFITSIIQNGRSFIGVRIDERGIRLFSSN